MKLTIRDIAKMAGVSPATVSKIINNYGGISEKTTKQVMKIIEETGYQPTFSAKSLATKKSNLIGLIFSGKVNVEFNHPFFNEVLNAFKKTMGDLGYDILMFSNEQLSKTSDNYLARARHFHLDGCLIIAGEEIESAVYELDQSEIPCVGIDLKLSGSKSSYVMTDNTKLSFQVVEHFYLNGVRDIGYIGGKEGSFIASIRKEGFMKAMKQFGLPVYDEWVYYGDFTEQSGYDAMKYLLANKPYPKAVFAASDMMALGAIRAIKGEGLKVPEDIRVIGCDDIEACRYSDPKLSTVRQDKVKMGKLAGYILNDLINNEVKCKYIYVDSELVIRESCGVKILQEKSHE
ncbi:LacI family transcriptional regulator [Bacillus sp. HMF5848]|uniref:LacI family DNA-binding transcriptional regulator n=1 Tax=Bacillus sp. HMF5848 TaxID=2495421 RepID=UPI000F7B4ED8|nr:LacI family DNA-binding transcriptional regulator [Bacillus sp. HMF5848]RSK29050.1 LacI family transcriptional regulator [Bacillus sp. HMF5848]